MFGLTIEKLFLVALLAAVIIGPRRLPAVAARLAALIGRTTRLARAAARRLEEETGAATVRDDWRALDPRRYDPRRIIREAWAADDVAAERTPAIVVDEEEDVVDGEGPHASAVPVRSVDAGTWTVQGSSGHPRRVWVSAED